MVILRVEKNLKRAFLGFRFFNCTFSTMAGTKKSATKSETVKFIITTAAKSCKLRRIFSSKKKIMDNAPTVVIVAAKMGMKALRSFLCIKWSVMMMTLSIIKLSEMVMPANEYICISNRSR